MHNQSTTNFPFYRQPFGLLTISLVIGILIGFEYKESNILLPLFALTVLASALILSIRNAFNNGKFLLITALIFMLIGMFHVQNKIHVGNEFGIENVYQKGDVVLVRLTEVGPSDKEWKKMTGEIKRIYKNETSFRVDESILLFIQGINSNHKKGDELLVSSELSPIKNTGNPGEFDAANYWNKKGFNYLSFVGEENYRVLRHYKQNWLENSLSVLQTYLSKSLENNLRGNELAIAQALILGDKSLLAAETRNSFSNTGAMHVLAVSGLHIGLIMQLLLVVLSQFSSFLSKKYAVFIVVVILWIYAIVTGLSPSVIRAVFMFSVLFISQVSGKQYDAMNVLFFTAFVLLLLNPLTLFDIGFQLSFLAMVGIFLFYKPIEKLIFVKNKVLQKVWQGTAIGFGAQLMTTPISLYYFHQFPNYFVLTNIGLMATSGLILGLGIFIFTISWWQLGAGIVGAALSLIIFISFVFIEWVEKLPGGLAQGFELPFSMVFGMSVLVLLLFLVIRKTSHKIIAYSFGLGMLIMLVYNRNQNLIREEICVFNARQVIVTIRKNQELFCFYQAKKEDVVKVKYVVEAYLKLHPGKVRYFSMEKKNWHIQSKTTEIQTRKMDNNFVVSLNKKDYFIYLNDYSKPSELVKSSQLTLIGMPWIDSKVDHSLQDGAFVRGL
jgi:competence protein ComEC